ncbi:unnamed protein product [Auanema sp. JU1783]|nr:unnamed protein product [Auanema sp. JU1783]
MSSFQQMLCIFFCCILMLHAIPLRTDDEFPVMRKRLSNEALLRLIMRNRGSGIEIKRAEKRSEVDRRSIDDDFSNCFLSPVQCMLPHNK